MEQKFSKIWVNSGSFPSDYKNRKFPVASGTAYSGISGKLDKQDNLVRYTDIFVNSHWEFSVELFAFWKFDNFRIFLKTSPGTVPTICLRSLKFR